MLRTCSMLALLLALPAQASPRLDEAKQALSESAPQHCEVLTIYFEAHKHPAGSAERGAVEQRLASRAGEVERSLAPQTRRYEAARARLGPEERAELDGFGRNLLEECARAASARHGVQLEVPVAPPRARPQVVPRAPPAVARQPVAPGPP